MRGNLFQTKRLQRRYILLQMQRFHDLSTWWYQQDEYQRIKLKMYPIIQAIDNGTFHKTGKKLSSRGLEHFLAANKGASRDL